METDEAKSQFAAILDALPLGVCMFTPVYEDGVITDFRWRMMNRFAVNLLSSDSSLVGQDLLENAPHLEGSVLFDALLASFKTHQAQRLEQFFPASSSVTGADRWYSINIQYLDQRLIVTFEDITTQKAVENHIKQLVFQDELTGIYNRRYFLARAPELIALAQREAWSCALIFFDLNGFKAVNDSYGHQTGDKLLQAVAWRLSRASREGDIFFRSGGDEFAFFLPNSSEKAALATANRIKNELQPSFSIEGAEHRIGASIGVSVMLSEEATVDKLLERADAAMYSAKERKEAEPYAVVLWRPDIKTQFKRTTDIENDATFKL